VSDFNRKISLVLWFLENKGAFSVKSTEDVLMKISKQ
jgi:hypothetical protein